MPPKMPFDTLNLQHQVRRNAEEVQNVIADLGSWEDDIKNRDKKLIKVPPCCKDVHPNPTLSMPSLLL
jgi:hypothetical protein